MTGEESERSVRCAQCGWTIAPSRVEVVILDDRHSLYLHKGGCPRPPVTDDGE